MSEQPIKTHTMDVIAESGVPFRVVVLADGRSENYQTSSMGDRTLVEFYDRRYDHTKDGQFVSRYYLDTMLEHGSSGLDLYGGVDSWKLDSVTFRQVREWLYFLVDRESVRV